MPAISCEVSTSKYDLNEKVMTVVGKVAIHINWGFERFYWVVVSNILYFQPYLGKWSNLTNIFQMGWNHQLDIYWGFERF